MKNLNKTKGGERNENQSKTKASMVSGKQTTVKRCRDVYEEPELIAAIPTEPKLQESLIGDARITSRPQLCWTGFLYKF